MLIFGGIFLLLFGMVSFFKPDILYQLSEAWKTGSYSDPSDLYVLICKISGMICICLGAAGVFLFFWL